MGSVTQLVKNLLAMQKTRAQSLVWEDPLEKGMATHSGILTWRNPGTEDPGSQWGEATVHGFAQSWT